MSLEKKISLEEKFERIIKDNKKLKKILLNAVGIAGLGFAVGGYFSKTPVVKIVFYSWAGLYLAGYGYCRYKRRK